MSNYSDRERENGLRRHSKVRWGQIVSASQKPGYSLDCILNTRRKRPHREWQDWISFLKDLACCPARESTGNRRGRSQLGTRIQVRRRIRFPGLPNEVTQTQRLARQSTASQIWSLEPEIKLSFPGPGRGISATPLPRLQGFAGNRCHPLACGSITLISAFIFCVFLYACLSPNTPSYKDTVILDQGPL